MSLCVLCGKVVLFREAHASCEEEYHGARRMFHDLARDSILDGKDLGVTRGQLEHLARARRIPPEECDALLAEGWDAALDHCLSDGRFTPQEMDRMREASFRLGVRPSHLEARGVPGKLEAFKRRTQARDRQRTPPPHQPGPPPKPCPAAPPPTAPKQSAPRPAQGRQWTPPPVGKKGKPVAYGRDWDKWLDEEARWRQNARHGKFKPAGTEEEPPLR